jgi:hypothetical protein
MKEKLAQLNSGELLDFKKGLHDMFFGYVTAMDAVNGKEKENVLYTYNQLNNTLDQILNEYD